jgi:hypothetical protein
MSKYRDFLKSKRGRESSHGFEPLWLPDFLFDFQAHLTDWAIRRGRAAIFADCGLGKTPMSLVWGENVVRKTNMPVLIMAPLAVSRQFVREGEKFGVPVHNSRDGSVMKGINVVNYERLHYFDPKDFAGVVCDEAGILKNFDGKMRRRITDFLLAVNYRLLGTATPAPNDYIELGTSSEALGVMGRNQMLGMFFSHSGESTQSWELKGHASSAYWKWVAKWARAIRKPSDFGYEDMGFLLPRLKVVEHIVPSYNGSGHYGFIRFAKTWKEQRKEKRDTMQERCEKVASSVPKGVPCIVWCHYNLEGDLLKRLIPGSVQVSGSDSEDVKEDRLMGFVDGEFRVLVTKSKIAGFGLNFQHCADMFCFPSHSYEAYYQMVRRCWRFGQNREVTCNLVSSEAERPIMKNMLRKERQAIRMFDGIIREMGDYQIGDGEPETDLEIVRLPEWMVSA